MACYSLKSLDCSCGFNEESFEDNRSGECGMKECEVIPSVRRSDGMKENSDYHASH